MVAGKVKKVLPYLGIIASVFVIVSISNFLHDLNFRETGNVFIELTNPTNFDCRAHHWSAGYPGCSSAIEWSGLVALIIMIISIGILIASVVYIGRSSWHKNNRLS